jgi:hypothetical protein
MNTYQLDEIESTVTNDFTKRENEAFRADFNAALRKNAKERILWMLKERDETRKLRKFPPDNEILPKELFEI